MSLALLALLLAPVGAAADGPEAWWQPARWEALKNAVAAAALPVRFPQEPPPPRRLPNAAQAARACAGLAETATLRLAVIGDSEPGRRWFQRMMAPREGLREQLAAADALHPDLIVQLGDFVSLGTEQAYRRFRRERAPARAPMVVALGNHDRASTGPGPADKSLFYETFGEADLAFDCGPARLVVVDNADQRLSPAQLDWLDRSLDTAKRKLVFMHLPPDYLYRRLEPATRLGYPYFGRDRKIGYFSPGAAELREILARRRVERVYMGHIHALARAQLDGVRYVLTGGGGSPLYPLPAGSPAVRKPHFLWVEADARGVRELVRTPGGFEEMP